MKGFAGVYFEKILKGSKSSIWVINIQLSAIGSVLSMIVCLSRDAQQIIERGFLSGYTPYLIVVIILQATTGTLSSKHIHFACILFVNGIIAGLAVALVVKYADNIYKGFASALAIVLSGLCEAKLFPHSFDINVVFLLGSLLVSMSSMLFILITRRDQIATSAPATTGSEIQ